MKETKLQATKTAMKKITGVFLALLMCISLMSPISAREVQAAETPSVSQWAIPDLMFGDTYGIYPLTWYEKDLKAPITQAKFMHLICKIRAKLVNSSCVKEVRSDMPKLDDSITVEEALEAFYTILLNYDYATDLGLSQDMDPVMYMKQIGVYTGADTELGLKERCSLEQAMVFATRIITVVYNVLGDASKGFLWEVKSGENTVYLLGSIHLASTDIYPFSSNMWKAYYNSSALIAEANLYDQEDSIALQKLMYYSDGTTLKDHVSAETYQQTIETAALLGIPELTAANLKPWALYLTFANYTLTDTSDNASISAQLGIDYTFETNAVIYQKPIYAVEGLITQGKMLDSFSIELQEYLLSSYSEIIKNSNQGTDKKSEVESDEYMDSIFRCWKTGDIEGYKSLTAEEDEEAFTGELTADVMKLEEEYQTKMFNDRDDAMAEYIDNLLKAEGSKNSFVVLGASHFISDYSVIDRLKKIGYEVNQIK